MSKLSICLLYPDLLGTYGDGGNALVLAQRARWRGIQADVLPVHLGDDVPSQCDLYVLGGGEDQPQTSVTEHLRTGKMLHKAVEAGAVVFAVCAGLQILGETYATAGDPAHPGLGLLDCITVRGEGSRRVGEITVQPDAQVVPGRSIPELGVPGRSIPELGTTGQTGHEIGLERLTGYENHGGITRLGSDARRLGQVITGKGNDDGLGSEGVVAGRILCTYLHGPVLARNPDLADFLLGLAVGTQLQPLDDSEVNELRRERFAASGAGFPATLRGITKRLRAKLGG